MGAAVVVFAIAAPWLVWLPLVTAPAASVILAAITLVAALYGWGRLVVRLARPAQPVDAALAMQWGVAAVLGVAGVMLVVRAYDARLLVLAGVAACSADLALRFRDVRAVAERALRWSSMRYWLVPALAIFVLGIAGVLAAAGQVTHRPFDDETHVIAQVQRLTTTGGLADPLGFPRDRELGGQLALGALASVFGDAQLARVADRGLGLVLFLLLACAQLRPRDAASAIWTTLVIGVAGSFGLATPDLLPLWIPAGLVLGLHATVASSTVTARAMIPVGLLAGALWVVRCELAPFALGIVAATWWAVRADGEGHNRRVARGLVTIASLLAVVAGYELARRFAWSSVGGGGEAILLGKRWPLVLRIALFLAIAAVTAPLLRLLVRELDDRVLGWFAFAASLSIAGIASRLFGTPPLSIQQLWPLALAGGVAVTVAVVRQTSLSRTALVVAAIASILVFEAQTAKGRRSWSWRTSEQMFDAEYARNAAPSSAPLGLYRELLARVPAGERVAVWVTQPELLDYERHVFFDLRTPRAAKAAKPAVLEKLARATGARWLLVEGSSDPRLVAVIGQQSALASRAGIHLYVLEGRLAPGASGER